jgi:hypothetical protein
MNKSHVNLSNVIILAFYSLVIFWIIAPRGFATEFNYSGGLLSMTSDASDIIGVFGGSDAGSYARCGIRWHLGESMYGVGCLPLWPPGMFFYYKLAMDTMGPNAPMVLIFVLSNSLVWGFVFLLLYKAFSVNIPKIISLLLPLLFIFLPYVREFLWGATIVMSESLSIGLFLISQLSIYLSVFGNRRLLYAVLFGVTLSLAAYFRAQFYLFFIIQALLILLFFLLMFLFRKFKYIRHVPNKSNLGLTLILGILISMSLLMPYLLWNKYKIGEARWFNADYYFAYPWMKDYEYTAIQGWILQGGGNVACKVNPTRCYEFHQRRLNNGVASISAEEYKAAFMKTLMHNPFDFALTKYTYLSPYWFSGPSDSIPNNKGHGLVGILILSQLIFCFAFIFVRIKKFFTPDILALNIIFISTLLGNVIVFMGTHFEVRYFYLFFSLIFFTSLLEISTFFKSSSNAAFDKK